MLISVQMDNCGNILCSPVSKKWRRKFAAHMRKATGIYVSHVFFQEGTGTEDFLQDTRAEQRKAIEERYCVKMRVDPYTYGNWLGWDAHTVVE